MKNKSILIAIAAISAVVAGYFLLQTEEGRIKRQFDKLTEVVGKNPQEGNTATAIKMLSLGNLLCEKVEIEIKGFPENGENSSESLVSLATRGRNVFTSINIKLLDIETEVLSKDTATSRCSVRVNLSSQSYSMDEIRSFKADMKKIDGKWLFAAFREDELLVK